MSTRRLKFDELFKLDSKQNIIPLYDIIIDGTKYAKDVKMNKTVFDKIDLTTQQEGYYYIFTESQSVYIITGNFNTLFDTPQNLDMPL